MAHQNIEIILTPKKQLKVRKKCLQIIDIFSVFDLKKYLRILEVLCAYLQIDIIDNRILQLVNVRASQIFSE